MKIEFIKTSDLAVDALNVRGDEWDNNKELVESIKAEGIIEPLLVRPIKGQKHQYQKNKTYSIICGGRRWHASMEARLKELPCIVRTDLDDVGVLGTSLQENLARNSLSTFQEAEAIAKMWEILNGKKSYDEKIKVMFEKFGLSRQSIERYISISRLSDSIKKMFVRPLAGMDTDSLASVSNEKSWSDKDKKEALIVASRIENKYERRKAISEMKKKSEDKSPLEAFKEYKREVGETIGANYDVYFNAKERVATEKAAKKEKLEINTLIKRNHINWLKKEGYL